jgi:hypothetical protein
MGLSPDAADREPAFPLGRSECEQAVVELLIESD